jgi:hypothetical protein
LGWLLISLGWLAVQASAQVVNDQASGKIELRVNASPHASSTTGCTVEWHCVDKSLTGKCIEYHNDQWFGFTTRQAGTYFVNVSGQDCRDIRGVQLVVMEGEICRPQTYRILSCTSLATQDDIYVKLDSLPAQRSYLLNVDGYLNDFCQFRIAVSTQARGFPARSIGLKGNPDLRTEEQWLHLNWDVTEALAQNLIGYRIYRRHEQEKKSTFIRSVSHQRNTRGESGLHYSITDTLSERGTYAYQIIGVGQDSTQTWITEKKVEYRPQAFRPEDFLTLRLQYALNTPLTVLIMDASTDRLLRKSDFVFQRKGRAWQYYVGDLRNQGIYRFRIKVTDNLKKTTKELTIDTRMLPPEK